MNKNIFFMILVALVTLPGCSGRRTAGDVANKTKNKFRDFAQDARNKQRDLTQDAKEVIEQ